MPPHNRSQSLIPLNAPRRIEVRCHRSGDPAAVRTRTQFRRVVEIIDRWRIDDEWWRPEPIARMYYAVELDGGIVETIFHDLITGEWYQQRV